MSENEKMIESERTNERREKNVLKIFDGEKREKLWIVKVDGGWRIYRYKAKAKRENAKDVL